MFNELFFYIIDQVFNSNWVAHNPNFKINLGSAYCFISRTYVILNESSVEGYHLTSTYQNKLGLVGIILNCI